MLSQRDLSTKSEVTFYYPLDCECDFLSVYFAELLDVMDGFLFPLSMGLRREDIDDYCMMSGETSFDEFLISKRYVCVDDDFMELILKRFRGNDLVPCGKITVGPPITTSIERVSEFVRGLLSGQTSGEESGVILHEVGTLDVASGTFSAKED